MKDKNVALLYFMTLRSSNLQRRQTCFTLHITALHKLQLLASCSPKNIKINVSGYEKYKKRITIIYCLQATEKWYLWRTFHRLNGLLRKRDQGTNITPVISASALNVSLILEMFQSWKQSDLYHHRSCQADNFQEFVRNEMKFTVLRT